MVLSFNVSFQNCCFKLVDKCYTVINNQASLVAQMVKNLPAMLETLVRSLGWEDPLENGYPLLYSCLEKPTDRGAWLLQSMGSQRVGHD